MADASFLQEFHSLQYTFPPKDAAKSYTLDVKWPTVWIYCSL